ncbi:MAG: hypothetical protein KKF44_09650 [Nanoarchaeota archaeon]|nr:hypothetical protein [Nanoarchaeota archaeon]
MENKLTGILHESYDYIVDEILVDEKVIERVSECEKITATDVLYVFLDELITRLDADNRQKHPAIMGSPNFTYVYKKEDAIRFYEQIANIGIKNFSAISAAYNMSLKTLKNSFREYVQTFGGNDDKFDSFLKFGQEVNRSNNIVSLPHSDSLWWAYGLAKQNSMVLKKNFFEQHHIPEEVDMGERLSMDVEDYLTGRCPASVQELYQNLEFTEDDLKAELARLVSETVLSKSEGVIVTPNLYDPNHTKVMKFAYSLTNQNYPVSAEIFLYGMINMVEQSIDKGTYASTTFTGQELLKIYQDRENEKYGEVTITDTHVREMISLMKKGDLVAGNYRRITLTDKAIRGYNYRTDTDFQQDLEAEMPLPEGSIYSEITREHERMISELGPDV